MISDWIDWGLLFGNVSPVLKVFKQRTSVIKVCMFNIYVLRLAGLKFEKNIIKTVLQELKPAKPSKLMFRFQVQLPTTLNELMLSAYFL